MQKENPVTDNILKKSPDVAGEDFLAEIYGSKNMPDEGLDGLTSAVDFSDNLETVSTKTHALLAGIRALVGEARIRFIGGRPGKRTVDDGQMRFEGF